MANKFVTGLETVGKDVLKVIEAPVAFIVKTEKVIETIVADKADAKAILSALVSKAEAIGADGAKDLVQKGLNPIDDLATLQAIEDLATYVKTVVVPFVEKVYGEVDQDVAA